MIFLKTGTGTARIQLQVPETVFAGEETIVNCTGSIKDFKNVIMRFMTVSSGDGCNVTQGGGNRLERLKNRYQKSFIITCNKPGQHTIECKTSCDCKNPNVKNQLQVIEKPPKIINKPCNITTDAGLPVTFTCYVEGDPSQYWVGWMSRQTLIQAGEEHSISTSPNFKSTNGTAHHLTIHSVKEAGNYECKVYTITGDVQHQVTHHVFVTDQNDDQVKSTSIWDTFKELFFGN